MIDQHLSILSIIVILGDVKMQKYPRIFLMTSKSWIYHKAAESRMHVIYGCCKNARQTLILSLF